MPAIPAPAAMLLRRQVAAAPARSLSVSTRARPASTTPPSFSICARCQHTLLLAQQLQQPRRQHARAFTTSAATASGHNRWSKIRHEKGAADMKKTAQRNIFAKHLTLYSKLYGGDPALNSQLASVIAAAKKAGMPKANIDAAVARGQGRSTTGQQLEAATFEVIVSGPTPASSVAIVVDIESDNKTRSIKDLRVVAKKHKALAAPTAFNFTRTGRIVLGPAADSDLDTTEDEDRFDDVLMAAVEAGAEDVEQLDEGNFLLWTQPGSTHHVAQTVAKELELDILESDIIYKPTAEMVAIDDEEAAQALATFLAAVKEYPDVQAVYSNAVKGAISDETWAKIDDSLDS